MIDAVIFDMDGLMLDTQKVWDKVIVDNAVANGLEATPEFLDEVRGSSKANVMDILLKYFGADYDPVLLIKQARERAVAVFAQGIDKKPGLDEILAWLKEHGVPMAVASGSPVSYIEHHTRKAGVDAFFDVMVSGEEVARGKPEPDVFLLAAERLGVEPARTLVLEDSGNGIQAAAAGGFIPVMVPDIEPPTDELRELAAAVCDTLADVIPLLESGTLDA